MIGNQCNEYDLFYRDLFTNRKCVLILQIHANAYIHMHMHMHMYTYIHVLMYTCIGIYKLLNVINLVAI